MNRRDLLVAGAALGVLAASDSAHAAEPAPDTRTALLDALAKCEAASLACDAHCARELAGGNKDMAACAAAVRQMQPLVGAARELVSHDAKLAKQTVAVCKAACEACAAACKEHEPHFAHGMHLECKACMEACQACVTACAAYIA